MKVCSDGAAGLVLQFCLNLIVYWIVTELACSVQYREGTHNNILLLFGAIYKPLRKV